MARYILGRLAGSLFVILVVSFLTFFVMYNSPGGPYTELERPLSPEAKKNIIAKFGLDKPFYENWFNYMVNALRGDFGLSYKYPTTRVLDLFSRYWGASLVLGVLSVVWSFPLGTMLGVMAALKRNTWIDRTITVVSLSSLTIPQIALIFFLLYLFAVSWKTLPYGGWPTAARFDLRMLILPVLIFGLPVVGSLARYVRSGMLDVLGQDYIRTAKAKGLRHHMVIFKHAMRNMLIPVITVFGPVMANAITGSAFVERMFVIPGIANFFLDSVAFRDYPMIMFTVLITAVILMATNLVTDIAYTLIDPRVRLGRR
jgi:ABC-type dipeptide/oligopeptide/nickel transport system permease component